MCGFVCHIHEGQGQTEENKAIIEKMNNSIEHRGPDQAGYYIEKEISMGFRRLSIIDLSEKGSQPLSFDNTRYWIVFNGEIYNYKELKSELIEEGYVFQTETDTEVILGMYKKYGLETANKLRGMFAFIIWDTETKKVYGARDHFGIKPLYYMEKDTQNIFFASEKKALNPLLESNEVSDIALQHYLTFQYVPEPYTMADEIGRVEPGTYFSKEVGKAVVFHKYWGTYFAPVAQEEKEAAEKIRKVLFESVEKHMFADVTVGSFLSGGIDSSIIVAIAREYNKNIETFSVGFEREGYSEISLAKDTAQQLGVKNYSKVITAKEFVEKFPRFVWFMDDPLADPAAVPQFFCAELARERCKVALSGEGADELFAGYTIYNEPNSLKMFQNMPSGLLKALHTLSRVLPKGVKGQSFLERGTTPLEKRYVGNANIFNELQKQELMMKYRKDIPFTEATKAYYDMSKGYHPIDRMQFVDTRTWLVGDLLLNADRTTMAASLELRTPFVDKEVFEVAKTLPASLKIANGTTKYILRKAVEGVVPNEVLYRKKLGFPVPIRFWLKEELHEWAKEIIKQSQTDQYLNKSYILSLLEDHKNGKFDYSRQIWTVLTFMVWYDLYITNPKTFKGSFVEKSFK